MREELMSLLREAEEAVGNDPNAEASVVERLMAIRGPGFPRRLCSID
jgi:hypothetical protein